MISPDSVFLSIHSYVDVANTLFHRTYVRLVKSLLRCILDMIYIST